MGSGRGGEDPDGFGPPAKKSNGDEVLCVRTSAIVLDRDIGDTSGRRLGALLQCDPKVWAHLPSGSEAPVTAISLEHNHAAREPLGVQTDGVGLESNDPEASQWRQGPLGEFREPDV